MKDLYWKEVAGSVVFDERLGRNVYENGELKRWPRFKAYVGNVHIGSVEPNGKKWSWSSHLGDFEDRDFEHFGGDAKDEAEAKEALRKFVLGWLENFRDFMEI